jgi:hypothetical protein
MKIRIGHSKSINSKTHLSKMKSVYFNEGFDSVFDQIIMGDEELEGTKPVVVSIKKYWTTVKKSIEKVMDENK